MGHKIIDTYYYKGRKIHRVEDRWRQVFVIIAGTGMWTDFGEWVGDWYVSLADAKRVINGRKPIWVPL